MTTPIKPNGSLRSAAAWSSPPSTAPSCGTCNVLLVTTPTGYRCLNCGMVADRVDPSERHRRIMARNVGLSPEEPWSVIEDRAREVYDQWKKYTDAAAAFEACLKGLPSHVHTRPVCATPQCDNGPRKDGLCNRCYEAAQRGGESCA